MFLLYLFTFLVLSSDKVLPSNTAKPPPNSVLFDGQQYNLESANSFPPNYNNVISIPEASKLQNSLPNGISIPGTSIISNPLDRINKYIDSSSSSSSSESSSSEDDEPDTCTPDNTTPSWIVFPKPKVFANYIDPSGTNVRQELFRCSDTRVTNPDSFYMARTTTINKDNRNNIHTSTSTFYYSLNQTRFNFDKLLKAYKKADKKAAKKNKKLIKKLRRKSRKIY